MAWVRRIHFSLFLVAVIACLEIQFTEGRQPKAIKENKSSPIKIMTGLKYHARKVINFEHSPESNKDSLQLAGQKQIFPQITPSQGDELGSSDVTHDNAFGPTTPGNSPGVGHSLTGKKDNMQPKVQDSTSGVSHSVAAAADVFRPTGPGHSPGVGHSFKTMNMGSNY